MGTNSNRRARSGSRRAVGIIQNHVKRRREDDSRRRQLNAMGMPMADNKPLASRQIRVLMSGKTNPGKSRRGVRGRGVSNPTSKGVKVKSSGSTAEKETEHTAVSDHNRSGLATVPPIPIYPSPPQQPDSNSTESSSIGKKQLDPGTVIARTMSGRRLRSKPSSKKTGNSRLLLSTLKLATMNLEPPSESSLLGVKSQTVRASPIGVMLLQACLQAPLYAIAGRRNTAGSVARWKEASLRLGKAIRTEDKDRANETLFRMSDYLLDATLVERSYFEHLANLCHDMFGATFLPNKRFDEAFVTTDFKSAAIDGVPYRDYREKVLLPVWRQLRETTMSFIVGPGAPLISLKGGGKGNSALFQACVNNVIARGKEAADTATEIKKGVAAATVAGQMVSLPYAYLPANIRKNMQQQQQQQHLMQQQYLNQQQQHLMQQQQQQQQQHLMQQQQHLMQQQQHLSQSTDRTSTAMTECKNPSNACNVPQIPLQPSRIPAMPLPHKSSAPLYTPSANEMIVEPQPQQQKQQQQQPPRSTVAAISHDLDAFEHSADYEWIDEV
uniref:Wsv161-like protein n=1 Tax=Melicertus latisulcatus pemonivirus TaxID=2984278 RepID=A0A9C7EYL3_9VIRU|nr:MAG: wsv161-like protein [Melicertus latisulcatus pemonivirus]